MKLTDQVTSLELSKRLKKLGVKQESIVGYRLIGITDGSGEKISEEWYISTTGLEMNWSKDNEVAAFTVAELGAMLPEDIEQYEISYFLKTGKYMGSWSVSYCNSTSCKPSVVSANEAEARGLMLEYLITNNLLRV